MNTIGIGDIKSLTVIGVNFTCSAHRHEEFIQEWIGSIQAEGFDVTGVPLLEISMKCGGSAIYHTVDDIPLVDVPCPCGDPSHWLIKWTEPEG